MKILWLFTVVCYISTAFADTFGDEIYLEKEKDLLLVLKYVHQPLWNAELYKFAKFYKINTDYENYNKIDEVKEFVTYFEKGTLLSRQEFFSLYNPEHLKQAKSLFNVFYNAKDYETLAKVVAWARFNVNEKMFMYVVGLTITHRTDSKSLIMPPPYEMCPYQFINGEVIKKAQQTAMQGFYNVGKVDGYKQAIIPMNFTGWYLQLNDELKVSYLTEDPAWNAMYYNYNLDYPFWMEGKPYGIDKDRRGELFIFVHHQLITRYNLERISNDLEDIQEFDWKQVIQSGYHPSLMLVNGIQVPSRNNYFSLYNNEKLEKILKAEDHLRRIRDAIDKGYYFINEVKVRITEPEDVNKIGNLIQGNPDTGAQSYFQNLYIPKFLQNPSTAARDPLFYQFYNYVLKNYWKFMSHLKPYTKEEIEFAGVKIIDVNFDKIHTFFEKRDVDISNAIEVPVDSDVFTDKEVNEVNFKPDEIFVKTRIPQLNYKPFEFSINIHSDKAEIAIIRIFLGPKDDYALNHLDSFKQHRKYYYMMDTFVKSLNAGDNKIVRNSNDASKLYNEQTSYFELYKRVMAAKLGSQSWTSDLLNGRCSFVRHLRIPRGKAGGKKFKIFIAVSPFKEAKIKRASTFDSNTSCGVGSGSIYAEDRTLLYPLDREVPSGDFFVPNFYFSDVEIDFTGFKTD
jgi:hypothetical protein